MESTEKSPLSSPSDNKPNTSSNEEGQDGDSAFLIHSQQSLSQESLPETDNQHLVRQRRRRTSPEDHAILEAEYERNPKPDKSTRIEIVSRVALGEKEVQIWFQNRRQMTRRKSRPLLPHEVISKIYSSQQYPDTTPTSSQPPTEGNSQQSEYSSRGCVSSSQTTAESLCSTIPVSMSVEAEIDTSGVVSSIMQTTKGVEAAGEFRDSGPGCENSTGTSISSRVEAVPLSDRPANPVRSLSQTLPVKRRPGYFANRRSASFMIHDEVTVDHCEDNGQRALARGLPASSQPLKRTSSLIKLSLSLDGKAEVTTHTGDTPSPPRLQPIQVSKAPSRPQVGLQRSYSALEPTNNVSRETSATHFPRRPVTGRSRDARTWEFYCDSDARNALTEQAEREESGSATAAISLIRSCSQNKKVMATNPNKRNAHAQKPDSMKRLKPDGQKRSKPKLERAISSVAKMQTNTSTQPPKARVVTQKKTKAGSRTSVYQEGDCDSDKENWAPGTQTSMPPRSRPATAHQARRFLEENLRVPSQSASLDALMQREERILSRSSTKSSSTEGKENSRPEIAEEVAAFMGEHAPREVDDLDCVQNLLSLSQAAWQ